VARLKNACSNAPPSNTGGAKTGTLRYDSSSTNFSVEVEEPVSEPPVDEPPVDDPPVDEPPVDDPPVDDPPVDDPPEGDGLDHDDYSPGDATEFFILNDTMTTTCTFSDVVQSDWYAKAVNAFCSAGILVGYWENGERVFVKEADKPKGLTILVETLKVLIFASNYKYVGEHSVGSDPWYQFYLDEAEKKGLDINGLKITDQI
jgi:hypothetical protein